MSALVRRVRAIPSWQLTLGAALTALGFLIAAQLAAEGPRFRITSQERAPLLETALDLQAEQEALKAQLLDLREAIGQLEATGQGSLTATAELTRVLAEARIAAGLVPLTGPGLVIQLSDSTRPSAPGAEARELVVSGRDVAIVVEELWLAGAEAIAVNGERVTGATAIIDIGTSILVNAAYVAGPYQVAAIGPADMFARLGRSAGFVALVRSRADAVGIGIAYAVTDRVDLPAYAGAVNLRFGRVATAPTPSPAVAP